MHGHDHKQIPPQQPAVQQAAAQQVVSPRRLTPEEQKELNIRLWDALNDPREVQRFLDQGANFHYKRPVRNWTKEITIEWSASAYAFYKIIENFLHNTDTAVISRNYLTVKKLISKMSKSDFDEKFSDNISFYPGQPLFASLILIYEITKAKDFERKIKRLIHVCLEREANPNQVVRDGYSVLLVTTNHRDPLIAELLLLNGADPNQRYPRNADKAGWSFVECAIERDWPSVIILAVEKGVDPDQKLLYGDWTNKTIEQYLKSRGYDKQLQRLKLERESLILEAADEKSLPRLRSLLEERRANFQVKDKKTGDTLLHRAAAAGAGSEVLEYLIKDGKCGVNNNNTRQETPLFQAVDRGHVSTAAHLVHQGAVLDRTYGDAKVTLLEHALTKQCPVPMLDVLARPEPPKTVDQPIQGNLLPSLHLAARAGYTQAIEYFLDAKQADVNAKDQKGDTALQHAIRNKREQAVEVLLRRGARFDNDSKEDRALLDQKDTLPTIKKRLQNHLDSQRKQKEEEQRRAVINPPGVELLSAQPAPLTPTAALFKAADEKSLTQLRALRDPKADFQVRDEKTKDTLLHRAAAAGAESDVVDYLVECGVNSTNARQETPLYHAVDRGHVQTAAHLVQQGAYLDRIYGDEKITLLEHALTKRLPVAMLDVLAKPEPPKTIDQPIQGNQLPSLHLAAHVGHDQAIEYFIDTKKADVNAKDQKGDSALQHAVRQKQEQAVETLLRKGARFDGDSKEDQALLDQKDIPPAIKSRLENHLALQRRQKEERQVHIKKLTDVIFFAMFVDTIKVSPASATSGKTPVSLVEQLLQLALNSGLVLPTIRDEKRFGTFIKHRVLANNLLARQKPKDWYGVLEKDQKQRDQFQHDIQKAVKDYGDFTVNAVAIEIIANEICLNSNLKGKVKLEQLCKWLTTVLMTDPRLKVAPIDEQALQKVLVEELQFSCDETIHATQQEKIYQLRIKAAVDRYLHQRGQLTVDEKLAYELSQRLVDSLRKECKEIQKEKVGMKAKKVGIACRLIMEVLQTYPEGEPVLIFLKENPSRRDNFITVLFEKLKKEKMGNFSIEILEQQQYQNKLRDKIYAWLMSNKIRNISFSRGGSISRIGSPSRFDAKEMEQPEFEFTANQESFIEYFCSQLDDLYCKFKALDLKLVKRIDEKVDMVAKKVEENQDKFPQLNFRGFDIPTGSIAHFLTQAAVYLKDQSIEKAANRMARLFSGHTPTRRGQIVELAAQSIAYRYQHQIERLTPISVRDLALCAAYRAMEYITRCDENLVAKEPGFFSKLSANFSDYVYGRRQAPQLVTDLEDPVRVLMNGIVEGRSERDEMPIGTRDYKQWQPLHIFNNTGIIVRDEQQQPRLYTHVRLNKNPDGSPLYGFRYGTMAEVKQEGYIADDKTPLATALQSPVASSPTSSAVTTPSTPPDLTNPRISLSINKDMLQSPVASLTLSTVALSTSPGFTNPCIPPSINQEEKRQSLKPDSIGMPALIQTIKMKNNLLMIGKAHDNNDCFFDAVSQTLRAVKNVSLQNAKSLRMVCHKHSNDSKNETFKNWFPGVDGAKEFEEYKAQIQYTQTELDGLGKVAVWGEAARDGQVLCKAFSTHLHVINIDDKGNVTHQLITPTKIESIKPSEVNYNVPDIIHVACYRRHFVPLVSHSIYQQLYPNNERIDKPPGQPSATPQNTMR
jgi:ankyrin repeat protein